MLQEFILNKNFKHLSANKTEMFMENYNCNFITLI